MKTLRQVLLDNKSTSSRDVAARYSTGTLRQLIEADSSTTSYTYMGYTLERTQSAISIKNKDGESTQVDLKDAAITPEQRDEILSRAWEDVKKFMTDKFDDLKEGKLKAEDIGGVVYGSTATAIVLVLAPFAEMGDFGKYLTAPFVALATNRGRYWGAAVDELVAFLKGENEDTRAQVIGVLGTTVVLATYLNPLGGVVALGGSDAWKLTVSVGKWIGGAVEDALKEIGQAIPILAALGGVVEGGVNAVVDGADAIVEFFDDLF